MIISASRRTDIPAFYAEWLFESLKRGWLEVKNPFNPKQVKKVDLDLYKVDAIVFWTRYPKPLFKYLGEIDRRGYKYIFLFTITGYPDSLEPKAPIIQQSIESFKRLSDTIGQQLVIWRYDPIVISNITDEFYHLSNFERLAESLSGYTNKVIISFLDFYRKLRPRFKTLYDQYGIKITDVTKEKDKAISIGRRLKEISDFYDMTIQSCAEEEFLKQSGVHPGACIDGNYLEKIFNKKIVIKKDPNQRKYCLCNQSVDIGQYNTCRFNCRYCYAIR